MFVQVEAFAQGIMLLKDLLCAENLNGRRRNSSKQSNIIKDADRN